MEIKPVKNDSKDEDKHIMNVFNAGTDFNSLAEKLAQLMPLITYKIIQRALAKGL